MRVYLIQNTVNGKCYVGQTIRDLVKYLAHNLRRALQGKTCKPSLYRAVRKYGGDNFTIRSIHKCADKGEMNRAEKTYIKFLGTRNPDLGYNLTEGGEGGCTTEGRKHSESTKEKMRASSLGKPKSNEHRAALSVSKLGKKNPKVSESNRRRGALVPTKAAIRNRRYRDKKRAEACSV